MLQDLREKDIDLLLGRNSAYPQPNSRIWKYHLGRGRKSGKVGLWVWDFDYVLVAEEQAQEVLFILKMQIADNVKVAGIKQLILDVGIPGIKANAREYSQVMGQGIAKFAYAYWSLPFLFAGGAYGKIVDWTFTALDFVNSIGSEAGRLQFATKSAVTIVGEAPAGLMQKFSLKYLGDDSSARYWGTVHKGYQVGGRVIGALYDIQELVQLDAQSRDVLARQGQLKRLVADWAVKSGSTVPASTPLDQLHWGSYLPDHRLKTVEELKLDLDLLRVETHRLAEKAAALEKALK